MEKEKTLLNAVLCFLYENDQILLCLKKVKIGRGCRNGFGGGIEKNETEKQAALRELKEESGGIIAMKENIEKIAIIDFHNKKSDGSLFTCRVHVYLIHKWMGEMKETDEMDDPIWYNINNLPVDKMMPADREWLPIALSVALSGKKIIAEAYLGPFQKESLAPVKIQIVDSLPEN